jgi:two-component system KDP operon response regulator KdpE
VQGKHSPEERRTEATDVPALGGAARVRTLLLYARPELGGDLLRRLPADAYDVYACPAPAPFDGWFDQLDAELVLLAAPADARELLRLCEALRERTEAPLVVLSERADEMSVARALALGVDEYLSLPIGDRELSARLRALLRRARPNGFGQSRQVGGLVLSAEDNSVLLRGRRVFLSPIEFRLLACLASAPGKVLTHQTLMSRVWGAEYVDARHYLRVYVRYLREKMEDDPTNPKMILSEWGVGYRLQAPERAGPDDGIVRRSRPASNGNH